MASAARVATKAEFLHYPAGKINWFPGHMRKARRQLETKMSKIDIFLEVRDARIPFTSRNALLDELIPSGKKRIVIYNKADLAFPKMTDTYLSYTKEVEGVDWFAMSAKKYQKVDQFISHLRNKINPRFRTIGNWMMIGGVPNVGKSTIINMLRNREENIEHSKKSGARVGAVPCVTRSINGFKVMTEPLTYLIDTPGITQPKILWNEDGMRLWAVGSIRDGIIEHDTAVQYVLYSLNANRQNKYVHFYGLDKPTDDLQELMKHARNVYGRMSSHNLLIHILKDFREGKLGRITMDDGPNVEAKRRKQLLQELKEKEEEAERRKRRR